MAKVTLSATASDIMNKINPTMLKKINDRKLAEAKDSNLDKTELQKLEADCTSVLNDIDKQLQLEIKDITDESAKKVIRAKYNLLKVETKAEFEKLMKPLRMTAEQVGTISEVVATNGGEKVGHILATPVKVTVGFLEGVARKSGLNRIGNIFKS